MLRWRATRAAAHRQLGRVCYRARQWNRVVCMAAGRQPRRAQSCGGRVFKTKKEAQESVRSLLIAHSPRGSAATIIDGEDAEFLHCLIPHHHEASHKIGCGIARFEVRKFSGRGSSAGGTADVVLWLVRNDGTATDVSWLKCIDGLFNGTAADAVRKAAYVALRDAVDDQVRSFRASKTLPGGYVICEVTGMRVPTKDAHVDHAAPRTLRALVDMWLSEEGLAGEGDIALRSPDGQMRAVLADAALLRRWQAFHEEHAVLRMVEASTHLNLPRMEP